MEPKHSLFLNSPDIVPPSLSRGMTVTDLIDVMGRTSFEARNVHRGAHLFRRMIQEGDVIWLAIAGAGIAGGMGGIVVSLMEAGFIDVICSTGAQVYHDLHFAFGLPVKAIHPNHDDNLLRQHGDTRIYDIGIREKETLEAQDEIVRRFVKNCYEEISGRPISSWEFNSTLGNWVLRNSRYPERSFTAAAARLGVPIFWDSLANHSIAMNLVRTEREGHPVNLSAQQEIFDSAAITFSSPQTGFIELGGGGPKNFIQQTGPTISQIFNLPFEGAERGLQIGTASEKDGSLSGCTFSESVTWGKYRSAESARLVQIWGEYSVMFPLLAAFVLDRCEKRQHKNLISLMPESRKRLESAL
ncbi:MAG: deoxyhypusine synthase family protein [Deltaproteobacteria bacterium]|nr:deoxyhypusine synthase family protein [Deltaproteobacteria bacterium]